MPINDVSINLSKYCLKHDFLALMLFNQHPLSARNVPRFV